MPIARNRAAVTMLASGQNPMCVPLTPGPSTKRLLETLFCQQGVWLSKQTSTCSDGGGSKNWIKKLADPAAMKQRDNLLEILSQRAFLPFCVHGTPCHRMKGCHR